MHDQSVVANDTVRTGAELALWLTGEEARTSFRRRSAAPL